jgi:hypothetical protein
MMDGEACQKAFLALLEDPEAHRGLWRTRQFPFMLAPPEGWPTVEVRKTSSVGRSEYAVRGLAGCVQATTITGTEVLTEEMVSTAGSVASLQELKDATKTLQLLSLYGGGETAMEDLRRYFVAPGEPKPDKRPYWRKLERRRKRP